MSGLTQLQGYSFCPLFMPSVESLLCVPVNHWQFLHFTSEFAVTIALPWSMAGQALTCQATYTQDSLVRLPVL